VEDEVEEVSQSYDDNLSRQKVAALVKEKSKLEVDIAVDEAMLRVKRDRLEELTSAMPTLKYVTVMRATADKPRRNSPKSSCKQEAKRAKRDDW
jgi:hypothetical protein